MGSRLVRRGAMSETIHSGLFSLLVLSLFFAAGILSGFFFAVFCGERMELAAFLKEYFASVSHGDGLRVSFWTAVWEVSKWPLAAALLGSVRLGVVGVPALMFARGFLLSHAVSAFSCQFGGKGLLAALAAFGIAALLMVPLLFVVGCNAFQAALLRTNGKGDVPRLTAKYVPFLVACTGIMVLAVVLQRHVMPSVLTVVVSQFFYT